MSIVHKGYKHNFSFSRIISTVWEKLRAQEVSYEHTHTPQFVNHSSGKKKKAIFFAVFFFTQPHNLHWYVQLKWEYANAKVHDQILAYVLR